jgi:hypothetical protein
MRRIMSPRVEDALNSTGLPWHIDYSGRHRKIILDGHLVGILTRGIHPHDRTELNLVSQIRRAARGEARTR